jgi:hypothetical protein
MAWAWPFPKTPEFPFPRETLAITHLEMSATILERVAPLPLLPLLPVF